MPLEHLLKRSLRACLLPAFLLYGGCGTKGNAAPGVHSDVTNAAGETYFTDRQTGEDVTVVVTDDDGRPINNARVFFFDGEGFECFQPSHEKYTPGAIYCAEHNSTHQLSLTTAPLQVLHHDRNGNEYSRRGAQRFADWAEAGWDYHGCRTAEEVRTYAEAGSMLLGGLLSALGISSTGREEATQYLLDNWDDSWVGQLYHFNPSRHGYRGSTTTITMLEPGEIAAERAGNGIDDDCDGEIDERMPAPPDEPPDNGNAEGILEVRLRWDAPVDLDLHVYAPDGCHIYYSQPSCGNGALNNDVICEPSGDAGENIFWKKPPRGEYRVEVELYSHCRLEGTVEYTLSLLRNSKSEILHGTIAKERSPEEVTRFDVY